MKRPIFAITIALATMAFAGCATHSAAPHHAPSAPHQALTLDGPPSRVVDLPGVPGPGNPREVRVLVDEPALKLVSIVLRAGTVLPTHHSGVPVTIIALQGSGTVVSGAERLRLDPTHAVVLAVGVPHAVEPEAGGELVLLVHHLGRSADHH